MSVNLPTLYGQQYATNVQFLLQQKESRLRKAVTYKSGYVGKQVSPVDQLGLVEMQPVVGQFVPIGRVDAQVDRRWLAPLAFDLPQMVDTFDKLKILSDPAGSYVRNAVMAANRQFDRLIINAFTAAAMTGTEGATSTAILAGNTVSVSLGGTASGLNVTKLLRGRRLLKSHETEEGEPIYCAITAQDEESLLSEIQVINADYFAKGNGNMARQPVLVDGELNSWAGINFIRTELIATGTDDASGTSRSLPMWVPSGMHLGVWQEITTTVSQRMDIAGLPWQVYLYMMANATRIEEKKVVRIWAR
jgi:hypothetical protein